MTSGRTPRSLSRAISSLGLVAGLLASTLIAVASPHGASTAGAAHPDLSVEIISAPNFVVDSNIESPSSYGPEAAHIAAKVCNTGTDTLTDVQVMSGDFDPDGIGGYADSTPGTYPSTTHPGLTGSFSFVHEGGGADATRFVGQLAPNECTTQYYLVTYPTLDDLGNSVTGGRTTDDDMSLDFDMWVTATDPIDGVIFEAETAAATLRSEISAMANKIWPNTTSKVPNEYLEAFEEQLGWTPDTNSTAGTTAQLQGVWYDLGRVNKGFDANGDFIPDFDLWMQPVGDAGLYDPACTRLVRTYGVVIVKKNDGTEQILAFEDQLYFSDVAQNNIGAVGLVFYEFAALRGGCTSALTPYQEVASGSNNEKFNGDYGISVGSFSPAPPAAEFDKTAGPGAVAGGGIVTYDLSLTNTSATETLGSSAVNLPPVIQETIPAGSTYVLGSATTVTQPTGTTTNTLYYDSSIAAWTATEPLVASNVDAIQWWLDADIPATETLATRLQVTAAPAAGQVVIENTGGGSFGGGAAFLTDTTHTFITGANAIGDTVFGDDGGTTGIAGDGIQNGDEAGIDGITVSLYVDVNNDGTFDAGDLLRATTSTTGGGAYNFTNLPDTSYLVVMDDADVDIPVGWGPVASTSVAVTLAGSDDLTVDFALAPALVIDKNLVGTSPVAEGDRISYTIDVINQLKVAGEPTAQDLWLTALDATNSSFGDAGFGLNGPDGSDAVGTTPSNADLIATQPSVADTSSAISSVSLVIDYALTAPLTDDDLDVTVTKSGTPLSLQTIDVATLNAGSPGQLVLDITTLDGVTWTWADLQAATTGLSVTFVKNGGTDGPDFLVDAFGFRVVSLPAGGFNEATTLSPIPLTDTYDPTQLDFVSASVAPTTIDEATGTITWNDVGPVDGGAGTQVEVTFDVISSTTLTASYTASNTVGSTTATFADGSPTNSATDVESITVDPRGTISGTVWGEAAAGTSGWVGVSGVETGVDYGLPTVTVDLHACVETATNTPTAPGTLTTKACGDGGTGTVWALYATTTTSAGGDYQFDGLPVGFYYVDIDETSVPSGGAIATAEADAGAGVAGDQNNAGASCGTCDGIWGTPGATESSGLFNTIDSVGEDITNISFGYTTDAAVYGTLWDDVDGDGVRDAGDSGLPGWTVTAFDGVTSSTATTDADGNYVIDGLPAGGYTVSATTPGGETWTETFETDTTLDNSVSVTLAAGEINGTWDFAFTQTGASTIGSTVYWDWNGNATQDPSDEGVDGVKVDLFRDDNADGVGDVFVRTTTTVDGAYAFTSLPAGDYVVIVDMSGPVLPAGAVGDPDEIGPCTICDGQSTVAVDGTTSDLAQNFGFRPEGAASIGDTIYFDSNGNGSQGATEAGLSNITVDLMADMDANGTYVVVATKTTDGNGNYRFDRLPDGDYRVVADSADGDLPDDGVGNLLVPVISDTVDVTIASSASTDTVDIGYAALGSIGDVVFMDANGNGSQDMDEGGWANVSVALWQDTDDNGSYETQIGSAILTDANGSFRFSGLEPGTYEARVDSTDPDLGGAAQTGDPDRDGETCTDETYILLADVPCDSADSSIDVGYGTNYLGADFGYQPPGVVGDFVWNDANDDGVQADGEPGLANVTVQIWQDTDANGIGDVLVSSTFTDSDGNYSFASMPDDDYVVVIDTATLPFTMVATSGPQSAGAASAPTVVSGGSIDMSVDFGFKIAGSSSLAGTVCLEPSGSTNGACDVPADENELADVTVYLYDAAGVFLGSTTTDASGDYVFSGIPDGTYTVAMGTAVMPLSISDTTTPAATETAESVYQPATVSGPTVDVDFAFVQVVDIDLGDLDAPFDSSLTSGPYHEIGSLFLGASVDADTETLADASATGDDLDGTDDEDGVAFDSTTWAPDAAADGDDGSVDITVTGGSGYFLGWIDWNGDGAFSGTGELVANTAVPAGATTISFDIPDGTSMLADFSARFRLFAEAPSFPTLAYSGAASNGEIEDYFILGPVVPDAVADSYSATEDTALTISTVATGVMANDDEGNAPTTVSSFDATSTQGGTVAVAADGTFTYTPAADFVGTDTFTYTITDSLSLTDTATVTVTVVDGGSPDAIDDAVTIAEGTTTSTTIDAIGTGDVLTDDATYQTGSLDTTGTTGTVTDNNDGTFGYTPAPAFSGDDTFTYTICDDDIPASATSCDTATVTVTVVDTGSPDAIDDAVTIAEGTTTSTTIDAIGTGDVLTDDATYQTGSLDTTGTTGTVTDNNDGTFGYTPAPAFSGDDTFTYTICDDDIPASATSCDTATVTVTVVDTGSPDAIDDAVTIAEGTTTSTNIDAIGNPTTGDVLTDDATYQTGSLNTTGTTGTVTDNNDGTFGYTPAPAFSGDDTFTYTICDDDIPASATSCDTATVTVTVVDTGSPDAIDDAVTIAEGTTTSTNIDAIGNPTTGDVLTDDATYQTGSLNTTGTTGTVTDNNDGTFGYTPAPAFSGDDTFTYTICDDDPTPTCDTATVTVTVVDTGSPDAIDDAITIAEGTTTSTNIDAIGNPTTGDVLTDNATYQTGSLNTTGTTGTVTDNNDGTFGYTPAPAFSGDDTFTYTICDDDPTPTCDTATVTVTVVDTGSPDAIDDAITIAEGTTTSTTIDAIGTGDVLTDNATYQTGSLDTTGTTGTVTDNNDGTFGYTPAPAFSGDDTFTYTICDDDIPASATSCDTATVTVTVTPANHAPVATDDSVSTTGDLVTIDPTINDSDSDGGSLTVTSVDTAGTVGSVTITNGTVVYTPLPGFTGDDRFDYTICDADGLCDTATVTVTVTNDITDTDTDTDNNLPPSITPGEGVPGVVGQPLPPISATDPGGDVVTFVVVGGSLPPGVTLLPNGTFSGVPTAVGTTTASVEVCDTEGACFVSSVVINISGVSGDLPSTGQHSRTFVNRSLQVLALGIVLLLASRRRRRDHASAS